ncbi:hypothetical protein DM586_05435 [Vibrio fluvialis]|nr:hypothetical protein DM586_05435 [Vibrio fluvialis]
MSGSSGTLLCHRPLRTVRASFPAYGSSPYKFTLTYEPTTSSCLLVDMDHFHRSHGHGFSHYALG